MRRRKMRRNKTKKVKRKVNLLAILFLALFIFIGSAYYYMRQANKKAESGREMGTKEISENKEEDEEEKKYDLRYDHEDRWIDLELTYLGSAKFKDTSFSFEYYHNKDEYLIGGYFNVGGQDTYERWREDPGMFGSFYEEDFKFREEEGKEYFAVVGRKMILLQFNMGMRCLHYYPYVMTRMKVDMESPYEENMMYFYECETPVEYGKFAEDQSLHPWGDWEEWLKLQRMIGEEDWSSHSSLPFEAY